MWLMPLSPASRRHAPVLGVIYRLQKAFAPDRFQRGANVTLTGLRPEKLGARFFSGAVFEIQPGKKGEEPGKRGELIS
jgi:hypothetical protein